MPLTLEQMATTPKRRLSLDEMATTPRLRTSKPKLDEDILRQLETETMLPEKARAPVIEDPQSLDLATFGQPPAPETSTLERIGGEVQQFGKALAYKPERAVPFSPAAGLELADVVGSARRLSKNEYRQPPLFTSLITQEQLSQARAQGAWITPPSGAPPKWTPELQKNNDIRVLTQYFEDLEKQEKLSESFGGRTGQIVQQMPAFMIEFILTGGLQQLGSRAAKKAGRKILRRYAETKAGKAALATGGFAVGTALRAAGMPQRIAEAIERRRTPQDIQIGEDGSIKIKGPDEGLWTSVWKGLADHYVEIASEQAGEAFPAVGKWLAPRITTRLPFMGKMMGALQRQWLRLHPDKVAADFAKDIATKAGFHGVLSEIGEEYIGDQSRAILGIEKFTDIKDPNIWQRMAGAFQQDTAALPEMGVSFALPGAGRMALEAVGRRSALEEQRERYRRQREAAEPLIRRARRAVGGVYAPGAVEAIPAERQVAEPERQVAEPKAAIRGPEQRIQQRQRQVAEELEARKAEVAAGAAAGPIIAQRYTRMEAILDALETERDQARRDALMDEAERIDSDIESLSNLEGKDIKELHRIARRMGITVPKGASATAIRKLLAGTADLSQITKTPTGYRVELPIAEGRAGRGVEMHEFDNFAEALDFLEEGGERKPPPTGAVPAVLPPTRPKAPLGPEGETEPSEAQKLEARRRAVGLPKTATPAEIFAEEILQAHPTEHPPPVAPEAVQPEAAPAILDEKRYPVQEVPVEKLKLSKDVPQFKEDADVKTGVIPGQQLEGRYKRLGTGNIVVWERENGDLEVITGRHRLDLARRTGQATIPAQVVKESEGFTRQQALILDAELNIMDEKGSVRDYVRYLRNTEITEEQARARGLLSRDKGRTGFRIAKSAGDDLYTAFINNKISERKAYAIANGARQNEAAQQVALQKAGSMSADELEEFTKILARTQPSDRAKATQGNLFGYDETALVEAEAIAKTVAGEIKSLKERVLAVRGALKRPELARKMGLEFTDEDSIRKEVERLENRIDELKRVQTNPALYAEMREKAGLEVEEAPEPVEEAKPPEKPKAPAAKPVPAEEPSAPKAKEEPVVEEQKPPEKPAEEVPPKAEEGIIYVEPARLEGGKWSHEKNKQIGEGDIHASYSADRIADGKIRRPFKHDGKLWVAVGVWGRETEAMQLVKEEDYEGETETYNERARRPDLDEFRKKRRFYEGIRVRSGKENYVLTNKTTFTSEEKPPAKPKAPEAKQPWKMTPIEYMESLDFERYNRAKTTNSIQELKKAIKQLAADDYPVGSNIKNYATIQADTAEKLGEHARSVRKAYEEGETIPEEVKRSYDRFFKSLTVEGGANRHIQIARQRALKQKGVTPAEKPAAVEKKKVPEARPKEARAKAVTPEAIKKRTGEIAEMPEGAEKEAEILKLAAQDVLSRQVQAEAEIKRLLAKYGLNDVEVERVEEVPIPPTKETRAERRGRATGMTLTTPERSIVYLALGADIETGGHEFMHIILPKLNARDQGVLREHYGQGLTGEEAMARDFGKYNADRKTAPTSRIRLIFAKIRAMLKKLAMALRLKGYRTVQDIFGELAEGRAPLAPRIDVVPGRAYEMGLFGEMRRPTGGEQRMLGLDLEAARIRQRKAEAVKPELVKAVDEVIQRTLKPGSNQVQVTPDEVAAELAGRKELFNKPTDVKPEVRAAFDQVTKGRKLFEIKEPSDIIPGMREDKGVGREPQPPTPQRPGETIKKTQIVDKTGKPLPVYHGTAAPTFDTFDTTFGAFFTPDKNAAKTYTRKRQAQVVAGKTLAGKPRVLKVYLDIRNPLDLRAFGPEDSIIRRKPGQEILYEEDKDEIIRSLLGGHSDERLMQALESIGYNKALFDNLYHTPIRYISNEIFRIQEQAKFDEVTPQLLLGAFRYRIVEGMEEVNERIDPKVKALLEELGFDGARYRDSTVAAFGNQGEMETIVAFRPEQILYPSFEPPAGPAAPGVSHAQDFEVRYEVREPSDIFFSKLQRAVSEKMPNKMDAAAFRNWMAKQGIRADESKWTGVDELLKTNKAVTKQQVLDTIAQNDVQLVEVLKDYKPQQQMARNEHVIENELRQSQHIREELRDRIVLAIQRAGENTQQRYRDLALQPGVDAYRVISSATGDLTSVRANSQRARRTLREILPNFDWQEVNDEAERFYDLLDERETLRERSIRARRDEPKFAQYKLPGGENYREVLLRMPTVEPYQITKGRTFGELTEQEREKLTRASDVYRSPHWSETNVLAHIRLTDRTDKAGKRILFVEEIQSDWGQKGREEGFRGEVTKESAIKEGYSVYRAKGNLGKYAYFLRGPEYPRGIPNTGYDTEAKAWEGLLAFIERRAAKVPQMPFSKTWHELAFKRVLRFAAEEGYDTVGWTTGEQQAERYNLSRYVDSIAWQESTAELYITEKGGEDFSARPIAKTVTRENLADYVGKEAARKLVQENEDENGYRTLAGPDLKIGGEGMKGFYDKILPAFVAKYGKKWGIKGVRQTQISRKFTTGAEKAGTKTTEYTKVHAIPVTAAMKQAVLAGQVKYEIRPTESQIHAMVLERAAELRKEVDRIAAERKIEAENEQRAKQAREPGPGRREAVPGATERAERPGRRAGREAAERGAGEAEVPGVTLEPATPVVQGKDILPEVSQELNNDILKRLGGKYEPTAISRQATLEEIANLRQELEAKHTQYNYLLGKKKGLWRRETDADKKRWQEIKELSDRIDKLRHSIRPTIQYEIRDPANMTLAELRKWDFVTHQAQGQYRASIPAVGTWVADNFGDLAQLRMVPISEITFGESTTDPGIAASVEQYATWWKQGKRPFPPYIVENVADQTKTILRTINRRRVLGAKQAGAKEILAWVSETLPNGRARYHHEDLVRQAVEAGQPIRYEVIEEYKDKDWAKKALSKGTVRYEIKGRAPIDDNQLYGINLALTSVGKGNSFILADGTGFGKTRQIIGVAAMNQERSGKPSLIITANKQIIKGNFEPQARTIGVDLSTIESGTYDALRTGKVGKKEYGVVIFDESHALKNYESGRAEAARAVKTDSRMFATATPMDKPSGAAYFLAEISGVSREEMAHRLGFHFEGYLDQSNVFKERAVLDEGHRWQDVWDNIIDLRDQAIKKGNYLRRELPFKGEITTKDIRLPMDFRAREQDIQAYWQRRINSARSKTAKRNYSGQRTGELSRFTEAMKIQPTFEAVLQDLRTGKKVIVVAEGVNPTVIKGLGGEEVPGFIGRFAQLLKREGYEHAAIYGPGDKAAQIARFQNEQVQIALMTPKSGGVGVDLDDTTGNSPRTMYIVTMNFAGDQFEQTIGRVSRRNTRSSSQVFLVQGNAWADRRRNDIAMRKIRTLRAIQQGDDLDRAFGFEVSGEGGQQTIYYEIKDEGKLLYQQYSDIVKRHMPMVAEQLERVVPVAPEIIAEQHEERARRVGIAQSVRETPTPGKNETEMLRTTGALKGQLTEYENRYESVRPKIDPLIIDAFFGKVKNDGSLRYFEALDVHTCLTKLLDGTAMTVREAGVISRYFGERMGKVALRRVPLGDKFWILLGELVNVPRTTLASGDMSGILRQARPLGQRYPKEYADMTRKYWSAFWSDAAAIQLEEATKDDPYYEEALRDKVLELPVWGPILTEVGEREERFAGAHFLETTPGLKQTVGVVVRASERSFVTGLNYFRMAVYSKIRTEQERQLLQARNAAAQKKYGRNWNQLSAKQKADLPSTGKEITPAMRKRIAHRINDLTGRSHIGRKHALKTLAVFLNALMFSPRFTLSRIKPAVTLPKDAVMTVVDSIRKGKISVRPELLLGTTSLASLVATNFAIMFLVKMGFKIWGDDDEQVELETDLTSANGGKIKIGNSRYDLWSGYLQPVQLMARLISGTRKTQAGKEIPVNWKQLLEDFGRSKINPLPGLIIDAWTGRTFYGGKFGGPPKGKPGEIMTEYGVPTWAQGVSKEVWNRLMFLSVQDAADAWADAGLPSAILAGGFSFFGGGSQTYLPWASTQLQIEQDKLAQNKYTKAWNELTERQQAGLRRAPVLQQLEKRKKAERKEQGPPQVDWMLAEQDKAAKRIHDALPADAQKLIADLDASISAPSRRLGDFILNDRRYEFYINETVKNLRENLARSKPRTKRIFEARMNLAKTKARAALRRQINQGKL